MIREFTKTGRYHIEHNMENQDIISWGENKGFSVITLADGVSSCKRAGNGARTAAGAITDLLLRKGGFFLEYDKEEAAELIVSHIMYELERKASEEGFPTEEYSSTVASILLDKKTRELFFFNLGDGLIAAAGQRGFEILAKPSDSSRGCYTTTTKSVVRTINIDKIDAMALDMAFIASDGAWRHMFEKNRLKCNVNKMISEQDYQSLEQYLNIENSHDDCSYVAMDLTLI